MRALPSALVASLLVAGCASSGLHPGQAASPPAPACRALPAAQVPQVAGSLDLANDRGRFCLRIGAEMAIFLSPSSSGGQWGPIAASAPDVLVPASAGFLTLPRGVRAAIFAGGKPGVCRVSSRSPNGEVWSATIVVGPK